MFKLGFDVCALAPSSHKARSLAMSNQPDVALIDVCLEGGREGIEIALWLRKVCEVPIVFVTAYGDEDTLERIHEQVPGAPVLRKSLFRRKLIDAVAAADPARDIAVNALCFGFSPPRTSGSWQ